MISLIKSISDDSLWTDLDVIFCPRHALEHSFPLLKVLLIFGDLFGPILDTQQVFSSFHQHFPNLKYLQLCNIKCVPQNLFVYLSKLESLEVMDIRDCRLLDEMFTTAEKDTDFPPAINTFKFLKELVIKDCTEIFDRYLCQQ